MAFETIQLQPEYSRLEEGDLALINNSSKFAQELWRWDISFFAVLREYSVAQDKTTTLLGKLGFTHDPNTYTNILAGREEYGSSVAEHLLCSLYLIGIIQLPYKRQLLNDIVIAGQAVKPNPIGFLKSIAETLEIDIVHLRQLIRLHRVELILQFNDGLIDEETKDQFFISLYKHIQDYYYNRIPSHRVMSPFYGNNENRRRIESALLNRNIAEFYKLIYKTPAPTSLATLFPYEVEFFRSYLGDMSLFQPRSRLENLLLQYRLENKPLKILAEEMKCQSNIPLDYADLDFYLEAMLLSKEALLERIKERKLIQPPEA